ncbi:MAG: hypothetical protein C4340_05170, partial [Armatimonadota bacterium]
MKQFTRFVSFGVAALLIGVAVAPRLTAQDEFIPDRGQKVEQEQTDPQKEIQEKIKKYEEAIKDAQ